MAYGLRWCQQQIVNCGGSPPRAQFCACTCLYLTTTVRQGPPGTSKKWIPLRRLWCNLWQRPLDPICNKRPLDPIYKKRCARDDRRVSASCAGGAHPGDACISMSVALWHSALWHCGTVALRHCGTAAVRHCGTVALWHCGTVALRHCGTVALWHCGTAALWHCGTAALWHCGTAALRHCGTVALWHCGTAALGTLQAQRPARLWPQSPAAPGSGPLRCPRASAPRSGCRTR